MEFGRKEIESQNYINIKNQTPISQQKILNYLSQQTISN